MIDNEGGIGMVVVVLVLKDMRLFVLINLFGVDG